MSLNLTRSLIVASVAAVTFTGCLQESGVSPANAATATPAASAARMGLPDFSTLVEQVGPSVVNIAVSSVETKAANGPELDENDPMYEFFRRFGIPGAPGQPGFNPQGTPGAGYGGRGGNGGRGGDGSPGGGGPVVGVVALEGAAIESSGCTVHLGQAGPGGATAGSAFGPSGIAHEAFDFSTGQPFALQ